MNRCCLVSKSCLTFYDPMDCGPPGSSVHGISQARILEWVRYIDDRIHSVQGGPSLLH